MAVAVRCEGLVKVFGKTRAVDDVTILIEPGELFFLLGPSGCGKTTLLRCIAGFCEPDAGRIVIGDREVTTLPPHRRDTGMVFQSYALWPHMTVSENVSFGLEMRDMAKADVARRVAEALAMVKMSDRAGHRPNQLSGGQQQRVALARALVIHPQCLLLDEPLSNLDAKLRLDMRAEIRRICKEAGLTAIYVTHDQKEALSIADRLAVIHNGRVVQVGRPLDVYRRPNSVFVAQFIGETNLIPGEVVRAEGPAVTAQTPVGEIEGRSESAGPLRGGERVTLSVRPEAIRLGAAPQASANVFDAMLHHTVYLGEMAQHQVDVRNAEGRAEGAPVTLKAFELNPGIVARDKAEPARVWMDPGDVVVLRD
jgi:iron(III) transport system ATP-binding protein